MFKPSAIFLSPKGGYYGLGVLAALIALVLVQQRDENVRRSVPTSEDGRIPNYYLKDASVLSMNQQGAVVERLQAGELSYFAEDASSLVQQPRMQVIRNDGVEWQLSADLAEGYGGKTSLWLKGNVLIERQAQAEKDAIRISTEDLWVLSEQQQAHTAQPIVLEDSMGRTEAVGMEADLASGRVQLLSAVQGTYVRKDH